jgi:hypothetical protein
MDKTDDDAKTNSAVREHFGKVKHLLPTREGVTKQIKKRARKIKEVIEDLPPYPGND